MKKFISNLNPTVKGISLAFLATLGMANVYVFSKAALLEVSFFQFQFYWFGFALIWNMTYLFISGFIKKALHLRKRSKLNLVIIGFLELGAATTMFIAIQQAENPTVVSFLSNATPIFVTILGIRFLGERFNAIEAVGIILTIGGVIMITYTRNTSLAQFFGDGSGWILLSSLFLSISIIFAKSNIKYIHPSTLAVNRVVFMLALGIIGMIVKEESFRISGTAMSNLAIGSFLGPLLTALAQYSALKYIEASRTMIIQATRGLFVLIGSMIYLSILPTAMQVTGGIVTILGVTIMTWGKIRKQKAGPR